MTNRITPETPDIDLVLRAKAGDLDAFEALAARHEQRIYSPALRMLRQEQDAEDVTQQTFLSAVENLDGFRGDASFSTWLLRIASHNALKVIRKRKGLEMVSLEAATEVSAQYDSVPFVTFPSLSAQSLVETNKAKPNYENAHDHPQVRRLIYPPQPRARPLPRPELALVHRVRRL